MKEILTRSFAGLVYILLLLAAFLNEHALIILFFIFGLISLAEFKRLIEYKSFLPFVLFSILYFVFGYWQLVLNSATGLSEATQILQVITIFVQLLLIKDLFTKKKHTAIYF